MKQRTLLEHLIVMAEIDLYSGHEYSKYLLSPLRSFIISK